MNGQRIISIQLGLQKQAFPIQKYAQFPIDRECVFLQKVENEFPAQNGKVFILIKVFAVFFAML